MQPNPSIEKLNLHAQLPLSPPPFDIDSVMASALKISMTFNISVPGGMRVIPSTVYLGHDSDYLYVGGKFCGMGMNPVSTADDTIPHVFSVFFDVKDNGVLEQPESGSSFVVWITENWGGGWYYEDVMWANYLHHQIREDSWITSSWYYVDNLGRPQPQPDSYGDGTSEYDNSTRTVTMLFSRLLSCPGNVECNAFQMRGGERWVMGFLLELKFPTNGLVPQQDYGYVDGWPKNFYPFQSNDASLWPKLVIDLTNPPQTIPGQTTPGTKT
jgi:hypothetical protein